MDRPFSKNKAQKTVVENAPNFCQIGCVFHFFFLNAPKFGTLGCLKKQLKKNFQLTNPNIQKFHLRAAQQFYFLGLSECICWCFALL